jgi:septum site-determining protein MinC
MPQIKLKQMKKEIFLDLSSFDPQKTIDDLNSELNKSGTFYAGQGVSVILADGSIDDNNYKENFSKFKAILNEHNIALKAMYNSSELGMPQTSESEIVNNSTKKAKAENSIKTAENHVNTQEQSTDENETAISTEDAASVCEYDIPESLYVKANLRAGQLIRYPGNVIINGDVNPSAEVIATGDVIVWGTVRGLVQAGSNGYQEATISALGFKKCQLRIADLMVDLNSKDLTKNLDPKLPALAKIENNAIMLLN